MITELSVKNFRSLKDVKLSPGPLTVLIGANGSGKSNILDSLRLAHQLSFQDMGIESLFSDRGGYEEVVWGGDIAEKIEVNVTWQADASAGKEAPAYSAAFSHRTSDAAGPVP